MAGTGTAAGNELICAPYSHLIMED